MKHQTIQSHQCPWRKWSMFRYAMRSKASINDISGARIGFGSLRRHRFSGLSPLAIFCIGFRCARSLSRRSACFRRWHHPRCFFSGRQSFTSFCNARRGLGRNEPGANDPSFSDQHITSIPSTTITEIYHEFNHLYHWCGRRDRRHPESPRPVLTPELLPGLS